MQAAEDAHVIDDQSVDLFAEDAVGPGDGLHKSVIAHGLVEIDGGAAGHIETGHPHGADENNAEGIAGVFEFRVQVFGGHPAAVRRDIQTHLPEILDLILRLGDDHGHIGLFHVFDSGRQVFALGFPAGEVMLSKCELQLLQIFPPILPHLVVHADGSRLVDGDDHRLAGEATAHEMTDDVLGDFLQPVVAGDQMILARELALQFLFLVIAELGVFK